jgi:hypothetical protein
MGEVMRKRAQQSLANKQKTEGKEEKMEEELFLDVGQQTQDDAMILFNN